MEKSPCTANGNGCSNSGSNSDTETASRKKKPVPVPSRFQRNYNHTPTKTSLADMSPQSIVSSSQQVDVQTPQSNHTTRSATTIVSPTKPLMSLMRRGRRSTYYGYHRQRLSTAEEQQLEAEKLCAAKLFSSMNQPLKSSTSSTTRSPEASSLLMSTQSSMSRSVLSESTQDEPSRLMGRDVEVNSPAIQKLQQFARSVLAKPIDEIVDEYKQIKNLLPYDFQCQAHKRNKKKSRYPDIFCLDKTRVMLKEDDDSTREAGDFIHANYVNSDDLRKCYILTQGPKRETIADFWHMVWQTRCPIIVMLCDYSEDSKSKCSHYIPHRNTTVKIGDLIIRNSNRLMHAYGQLTETHLTVSRINSTSKPLNMRHWRWTGWPDHNVPNDYQTLFRLLRECRYSEGGYPIIHCSAGVGRSGTFIALEVCLSVLRNGKTLNVKNCVELVRQQRAQSVQTVSQYFFLIMALLEVAATNELIAEKDVRSFRRAADKVCPRSKKIFGIRRPLI